MCADWCVLAHIVCVVFVFDCVCIVHAHRLGSSFLSPKDLWAHAAKEHHSWAEARKRLIFEVQQQTSVPLQPIEKRRLASNFMNDLLYSYPGHVDSQIQNRWLGTLDPQTLDPQTRARGARSKIRCPSL